MAITITTEPDNRLLASNSDIVYVMTSNSSSNDNYQYVLDVNDTNDNLIARFKQRPNPSGIGVFNLNGFVRNKAFTRPPERSVSETSAVYFNISDDRVVPYKIRLGEEWSSSPTSSIVLYNGVDDTEAVPAVTASNLGADDKNYFVPFVGDRRTSPSYDIGRFYQTDASFEQRWLTDMPLTDIPIRKTDGMWMGILWGPEDENSMGDVQNDLARVILTGIDENGADVGGSSAIRFFTTSATEGGDAPRTTATTAFTSVDQDAFDTKISCRHVNVLLPAWQLTSIDSTAGFRVEAQGYSTLYEDLDGTAATFKWQTDNCPYPIYRLAWLNKYGAWDQYNFTGVHSENTTRQDSTYRQSFVDYGTTATTTDVLDVKRRGIKQFNTAIDTNVTVRTGFLTQEWADWLEGLFISPSVYYIDDNFDWIPIVLTSATYEKKTNPRTQKRRNYNISWKYANQRIPVANG